ncbi:MAG: zinc ribbon domain-containing protein [Asgard group archaeon]|nr:zinc ribbon domain-containing protein [Asgard group archaeon]
MTEEKFVICPNCGALLEKGIKFCGFCGSTVDKPVDAIIEPSPLDKTAHQGPSNTNYYQTENQAALRTVVVSDDYQKQMEADGKVRVAWIFAWLTWIVGGLLFPLAIIGLIVTIIFAYEAKKLGSQDPRIKQAILIAVLGVVIDLAFFIGYIIWFIRTDMVFF